MIYHKMWLPGYGANQCITPTSNGFATPAAWQDHNMIAPTEVPIRIRVNFMGIRPKDVRLHAVYLQGV